jgi:hypothetical protein
MLGCVPENRFRQCRVSTAPPTPTRRTMTRTATATPPRNDGAGWMWVALLLGGALLLNALDGKKGK